MTPPTGANTATHPHETPSSRFGGVPLPRGLREDAENMTWETFTAIV